MFSHEQKLNKYHANIFRQQEMRTRLRIRACIALQASMHHVLDLMQPMFIGTLHCYP